MPRPKADCAARRKAEINACRGRDTLARPPLRMHTVTVMAMALRHFPDTAGCSGTWVENVCEVETVRHVWSCDQEDNQGLPHMVTGYNAYSCGPFLRSFVIRRRRRLCKKFPRRIASGSPVLHGKSDGACLGLHATTPEASVPAQSPRHHHHQLQ